MGKFTAAEILERRRAANKKSAAASRRKTKELVASLKVQVEILEKEAPIVIMQSVVLKDENTQLNQLLDVIKYCLEVIPEAPSNQNTNLSELSIFSTVSDIIKAMDEDSCVMKL